MIDRSLAARLLSPAGLILAGVGLLLPLGAVSCTVAPGAGAALTYTGTELIGKTCGTLSKMENADLPSSRIVTPGSVPPGTIAIAGIPAAKAADLTMGRCGGRGTAIG
jgi:hypothetical protein